MVREFKSELTKASEEYYKLGYEQIKSTEFKSNRLFSKLLQG